MNECWGYYGYERCSIHSALRHTILGADNGVAGRMLTLSDKAIHTIKFRLCKGKSR